MQLSPILWMASPIMASLSSNPKQATIWRRKYSDGFMVSFARISGAISSGWSSSAFRNEGSQPTPLSTR